MNNFAKLAVSAAFAVPGLLNAEILFSIDDLVYEGASRIPIGTYGESRMAYTEGTFTVTGEGASAFMVGHSQDQAIAEFSLPSLSKASSIGELPMASNKQPFSRFFGRLPSGNPEDINRITGMKMVGGQLIVNGVKYYDGGADNTDTTFVIENPGQLGQSPVTGFLKLGGAAHTAGWISSVPQRLQDEFNGSYIFGFASNLPINSRSSIGPSAFGVKMDSLLGASSGSQIEAFPLIDYSIENPLAKDLYNESGGNDLWTEVSKANIGFIVPGSDTYAVFGSSGGHRSGIGYKITQDSGRLCGGPCPYEASDIYNYYWLYDVKDMQRVANGQIRPHEVRPYEYGAIEHPFQGQDSTPELIIGASFNEAQSMLYILLGDADELQNQYENAPILLGYSISLGNRPRAPSDLSIQ